MSYLIAPDVSMWQGVINWSQVPHPIAILKASGGDAGLYTDSKLYANYPAAKNSGKAIGMYHFAGGGNAVAEANYFVAACQPLEQDDVFILDWEVQHPDPVGWCLAFVNRVKDLTGCWPLLYINLATLRAYNWQPVLQNCGLWIAAWTEDPNVDINTNGQMYVLHQYTSNGSVPGIAGRVDLNAWWGTVNQFKKYGYKVPTTPTPTPPPTPEPTPQPPTPTPEPTPEPPTPTPEPSPAPNPDENVVSWLKRVFAWIKDLLSRFTFNK